MSKGIPISPKHGLNPCIPVCFFCGEQKKEIALLGKLKGDMEAPMNAVLDYEPCEKCQANWNMGVPLIRVTDHPNTEGQPPISTNKGVRLYPSGHYSVMSKEAVKRIFDADATVGAPVLVDNESYDFLMEQARASGAIDENGNAVTE